ncbi:MAG: stage V sporulation protein S [Aminipila sp.]
MEKRNFKVSATSKVNSLAGAIATEIRENQEVEVQAIGAGAVNQAIKAIAVARGFVAPGGIDLVCVPAFKDFELDGQERTAMVLNVNRR